jgi:hypothetical protein
MDDLNERTDGATLARCQTFHDRGCGTERGGDCNCAPEIVPDGGSVRSEPRFEDLENY